MFAPLATKAQKKAAASPNNKLLQQRSAVAAQGLRKGAVEQAHFLQRTLGSGATQPLLPQWTRGLTENELADQYEQKADRAMLEPG